jgi:hypothetical protein
MRNAGTMITRWKQVCFECFSFLIGDAWLSSCLRARHTRCTCGPRSTRYIKIPFAPIFPSYHTIPVRIQNLHSTPFRFVSFRSAGLSHTLSFSFRFLHRRQDTMFIFLCIHIELPPLKRRRGTYLSTSPSLSPSHHF